MGGTFYLKYHDTLPVLDVELKNPDGTAHDLAGSTAWKLHVKLPDGTIITRDMVKVGADADGKLRYAWVAGDWDAGQLVSGAHPMEYEVLGPSSARFTFPNDGHDTLKITPDLGQG